MNIVYTTAPFCTSTRVLYSHFNSFHHWKIRGRMFRRINCPWDAALVLQDLIFYEFVTSIRGGKKWRQVGVWGCHPSNSLGCWIIDINNIATTRFIGEMIENALHLAWSLDQGQLYQRILPKIQIRQKLSSSYLVWCASFGIHNKRVDFPYYSA